LDTGFNELYLSSFESENAVQQVSYFFYKVLRNCLLRFCIMWPL